MVVFDDLKSIAKVLQEAGKIEQYRKILEVQEKLLEMQKRTGELDEENKKLQDKLAIKENLFYKNNAYWIKRGSTKDGPFCSRCWDKNKDLIRMHPMPNTAYADCPECKNSVQIDPSYNPEHDFPEENFHF